MTCQRCALQRVTIPGCPLCDPDTQTKRDARLMREAINAVAPDDELMRLTDEQLARLRRLVR